MSGLSVSFFITDQIPAPVHHVKNDLLYHKASWKEQNQANTIQAWKKEQFYKTYTGYLHCRTLKKNLFQNILGI